ncbi:hypothetical protein D9M70_616970 [compost metagenome]
MSEEELRHAYIVHARQMHHWAADAQPERDRHGRFDASWIEWEFMIFKAGYQTAAKS